MYIYIYTDIIYLIHEIGQLKTWLYLDLPIFFPGVGDLQTPPKVEKLQKLQAGEI